MRYFLLFLTVLLLSFYIGAYPGDGAEEIVITGRVVSLDPVNKTMIITPGTSEKIPEKITVVCSSVHVPQCIQKGTFILVQGHMSPNNENRFIASHIGFGRNRKDPTGVRSRIGKCRMFKSGMKQQGRCIKP